MSFPIPGGNMKPILTIPLAAAMLLTGCTSLVSLNPFFTDEEAVADPALAGVWTREDTTFAIKLEDKTYSITYIEKSTAMKFEARMIRVGDAKLLDLVPVNDDPFVVPVHSLVRVWTEGATLRWTFLETDWLKEQVGRHLAT